jgi:hypothetical protein
MRKCVKQKLLNSDTSGWDKAIQEARLQLARMEQRVAGLKMVISSFIAMRDSGQEFHGESATQNGGTK